MVLKKVKIELIKSPIGYNPRIRGTVRALGFKKMHQIREHELSEQVKGMIKKVNFLVKIVEDK